MLYIFKIKMNNSTYTWKVLIKRGPKGNIKQMIEEETWDSNLN